MKITFSGDEGSGKDTQAPLLIARLKELGYEYSLLSIGNLRREAAKSKGMELQAFNEWSKANPDEGDRFFDEKMRRYGEENDNFIAVARLGWYLVKNSVKIFFEVDPREGARRIYEANLTSPVRNELSASSIEQQMEFNMARVAGDRRRYMDLYGIEDHTARTHFDHIIPTTGRTKQQVNDILFEIVLQKLRK